MHATLPLLNGSYFPLLTRSRLDTLQVNLGYVCNQSCLHCHVNAGPRRTEIMSLDTINQVIDYFENHPIKLLDLTGGAPELNPHFRMLVKRARAHGITVIDRCNLTILSEPGQEDLAEFLAEQGVNITASLPCYSEENVNKQRGKGVFDLSIHALQTLNKLGYGKADSTLKLDLVYNPQGPVLPPNQAELERDYKTHLKTDYDIEFNQLLTITNMPIQRFGSTLLSKNLFDEYMALLRNSYQASNLDSVMCRSLISIDWQGYLYDCDFNQMLNLPAGFDYTRPSHIRQLSDAALEGKPIVVKDHCFGCTAGQGSSCGGALD